MAASRSATVIVGGRVFDIDGDVDHPPVADLLIEDGRIVAVGGEAPRRAAQNGLIHRLDADGKLIIPGLINAHYHAEGYGAGNG